MTARDHARRAAQRLGAGERPDATDAGPGLPDRLAAARERKGVDLVRAERDTKIRVRYLSALERGDYRDLPGAVYTKGFLRNYAIYLGLDPEDVLRQWRRERGDQVGPEPIIVPPRPLDEPARPLRFSPSIVVAALLTVGVVLFFVYLSSQLLRYSKPPELTVSNPATAVYEVDEATTSFRLAGTATAGSTITITAAGQRADPRHRAGERRVELPGGPPAGPEPVRHRCRQSRDRQDVRVAAYGGHHGAVPRLPGTHARGDPAGRGHHLRQRRDRDRGHDDEREDRDRDGLFLGADVASRPPRRRRRCPRPRRPPGQARRRRAHPGRRPNPVRPSTSRGRVLLVAATRAHRWPWAITVTATSAEGKTASLTRQIIVAYSGVNLVVSISGGPAWIKVWIDGKLQGPGGGTVYQSGRTLTYSGTTSVEIRTGSSGNTRFTVNGVSLGTLGKAGRPRDLALRAARGTGQDAAAVAVPGALVALAERLQGVCLGRGLTVAVAESCTGGLVAATITEVPGSSGYFLGGVVAYANAAKETLLGVPEATLAAHGAVSAQVAVAMAAGTRATFGPSSRSRSPALPGPTAAPRRSRWA